MEDTPEFGPEAQTALQRTQVLEAMKQAVPRLRRPLSPHVQQLHARYLAGELSWLQVYALLDQR